MDTAPSGENPYFGRSGLRKRVLRAPLKRLFQASLVIWHFRDHSKLSKSLAISCFRDAVKDQPGIPYKYVGSYLARFFSTEERLRILTNHFQFFQDRFGVPSNRIFPSHGLTVWSKTVGTDLFSISMSLPDRAFMEGDMGLVFSMNESVLHTMSFSFVPGEMLGVASPQAIFIGGSQGGRAEPGMHRHAAKSNGEICPADMLLLALRALARALGVGDLVGVSCKDHSARDITDAPSDYQSAYDNFWQTNGGEHGERGYRMSAAISDKPITLAASSHRSRARRKRARKQELMDEICGALKSHFHIPEGTPMVPAAERERRAGKDDGSTPLEPCGPEGPASSGVVDGDDGGQHVPRLQPAKHFEQGKRADPVLRQVMVLSMLPVYLGLSDLIG